MTSEPIKTYKYSGSFKKQGTLMLIVGVILIIPAMMIPPLANAAGLAIVIGLLKIFLYGDKDIIKVFAKHIEIKVAPLAALKIIKFDDIKSVVKDKKIITMSLNSSDKPIKLHTRLFNKDEYSQVFSTLEGLSTVTAS